MFDEKDGYLGFTFAGHHSSEYGLLVVSDGSRYHQNLFSDFTDTVTQVPGKNGGHYFGTQIGMRNFDLQCAFDDINTHTKQKIEQWLYPDKTGWLIFDEMPYKKYYVKISQNIQFNFLPFDEYKTKGSLRFQRDILKGEVTISFFSFYEYGIENENYELPSFTTDEIIRQYAVDSGLLPSSYPKDGLITTDSNSAESVTSSFSIYNAGSGIAKANFYFTIDSSQISENSPLEIFNYDDGNNYILNDPSNIVKKYVSNDIASSCEYRIEILGDKQEVWLTCTSTNFESSKINIGACYNHYFPKIYHKKPSDIMIVNQPNGPNTIDKPEADWSAEPIFYSYSLADENFISSDGNGTGSSLEEFQNDWSDYTVMTVEGMYSVNNIINPATLFFSSPKNQALPTDSMVFLIYPNKFHSNKTLKNFTVQFKNTYI